MTNRADLYEKIPIIEENGLIRVRHFSGECYMDMHWHENLELLYFIKGQADILCGDQMISVHAGDLLIVNSNEIHSCPHLHDVDYYCLLVSGSLWTKWQGNERFVFQNHLHVTEPLRSMLQNIVTEWDAQKSGYVFSVCAYFSELLVWLIRHQYAVIEPQASYTHYLKQLDTVNTVKSYISQHYREQLSMADLVEKVYLSQSYLCHTFRSFTGYSIMHYLNHIRIQIATELIETSQMPIREIADKCGINDYNYFIRLFKKEMGTTPLKYRKSLEDALK